MYFDPLATHHLEHFSDFSHWSRATEDPFSH